MAIKKKQQLWQLLLKMLSHEDSNLDKQNQNLLCYHYTIGQSYFCFLLKSGAKVRNINLFCKCFMLICGGRGVVSCS